MTAGEVTGLPTFGGGQVYDELPRRAWVEQIMGLPVSVHVRGPRAGDLRAGDPVGAAVAAVMADLRRADTLFSTWQASSQVSRLRRGELDLADCDPFVREVVDLCEQARRRTDGWFDAELPGPDGVRAFDPTGLVKGWAVQRAARHLAGLDGHDFLVNAGGDVIVGCRRTDTPDWTIGIEDPADRGRILARVPLRAGGIATSGSAARGSHILVPATGLPADALASVSVIGPSLMWADVYATAAFARGPQCVDWLATLAGHVALVVGPGGVTSTVTGP